MLNKLLWAVLFLIPSLFLTVLGEQVSIHIKLLWADCSCLKLPCLSILWKDPQVLSDAWLGRRKMEPLKQQSWSGGDLLMLLEYLSKNGLTGEKIIVSDLVEFCSCCITDLLPHIALFSSWILNAWDDDALKLWSWAAENTQKSTTWETSKLVQSFVSLLLAIS